MREKMMIRERSRKAGGSPPPTPTDLTRGGGGGGGGGRWWGQRRRMGMTAGSNSIDAPPLPLIALFGMVLFYLYLSTYLPFKEDLHRGFFVFKLLVLILLPALLFFLIRSNCTAAEDAAGAPTRRWYDIRVRTPEPADPLVGTTVSGTTS